MLHLGMTIPRQNMHLLVLFTFLLFVNGCAQIPPGGNRSSIEEQEIQNVYAIKPTDSPSERREKELKAGDARVAIAKLNENKRAFRMDTVVKTTLSHQQCSSPLSSGNESLGPIHCDLVYDYFVSVQLSCQDRNKKLRPNLSAQWSVGSMSGIERVSPIGRLVFRFDMKRSTKLEGSSPAFEDSERPSSWNLKIIDSTIEIESDKLANKSVYVPDTFCK